MFCHFSKFLVFSVVILIVAGCEPGFQGEYSDPAKQEIVDDKWNETDARKTAQSMIEGMISKPWIKEFKNKSRQRPVLVVVDVENRTDEHLDVKALTEYIRDELVNSRQVRFVSKKLRQTILDEYGYQQSGVVNNKTAKKGGNQIGADFILTGAISSQVHSMDEVKTVTYQTALTLTNIETAEIEWSNKYQIKKRFKRSGVGW